MLYVSAPTVAAGFPDAGDAREVLRRFAEARKNLKSYIVKGHMKSTYSYTGFKGIGTMYTNAEWRFDGNRVKHITRIWGDININDRNIKKENADYWMDLWDGQTKYNFAKSDNHNKGIGGLRISDKGTPGDYSKRAAELFKGSSVGAVMGYHYGDKVPIGELFLGSSVKLQLRDKRSNLRGVDCYVIQADVPGKGDYTVWIDPVHDYHIARIRVQRGPGDRMGSESRPLILQEGAIRKDSYEVLEFEKKGGAWFPKICKSKRYGASPGYKSIGEKDLTFSMITLDPDHDALKSFTTDDIPNGCDVRLRSLPPSTKFVWQDGKVVDNQGSVVLDCIPKKPSNSAESKPKSPMKKRPTIWEFVRKYAAQQAKSADSLQSPARIVRFPKDNSIGRAYIVEPQPEQESLWNRTLVWPNRPLGHVRGDVNVPAGKMFRFDLWDSGPRGREALANLGPNDVQILNFYQCKGADDRTLAAASRLTGLKVLFLGPGRFTLKGLKHLTALRELRALQLPSDVPVESLELIRNKEANGPAIPRYLRTATNRCEDGQGRATALANAA